MVVKDGCLYTDLYQLKMMQGYFLEDLHQRRASFDYFFRQTPFKGGYVIFAGLQDLLNTLTTLQFDSESLAYLKTLGFHSSFLKYLASFQFKGDLVSVKEGEVVFPGEPLMRVSGSILETQYIETLLLNTINFQSLIATKAARITDAAQGRVCLDFGMRRAQGLGAMAASRAAMIGGFQGTSNVAAAMQYQMPAVGTMAHAWVQGFDNERLAFERFVELYGNDSVLLVDTYNTLSSGVPNAIAVALAMRARGQSLKAIRLDSGDLTYLSQKARALLDENGLNDVEIVASNQLDESIIQSVLLQKAPIDIFAVGTRLVTGDGSPALDGVYKLATLEGLPTMKVSENVGKRTLPGDKSLYRCVNKEGLWAGDVVTRLHEKNIERMTHPIYQFKTQDLTGWTKEPLLEPVMTNGMVVASSKTMTEMAAWSYQRRAQLPAEYRRLDHPHLYKVGVSDELLQLQNELSEKVSRG